MIRVGGTVDTDDELALARLRRSILERAWEGVHDTLPAQWRVGPVTYDPDRRTWTVAALGPLPVRRGQPPNCIEASGEDEIAALSYLAVKLAESKTAGRMEELRRRLRLAYLSSAEEWSRVHVGRPLSGDEQRRLIEDLEAVARR